jgi:[pyruvate, water dikinase]-phosphate phosphotransferase / [pyruvate, water dikinase] kinase
MGELYWDMPGESPGTSRKKGKVSGLSQDKTKKIIIISDGTGKTAKRLLDAVLAQYSQDKVNFSLTDTYHDIRDKKSFDRILKHLEEDYLVIYSIISRDLSRYIRQKLNHQGILNINVLEPMLGTMSKFLGVHPDYRPGILQIIDDRYYKKVDAIGYTVEHDDGRGPALKDADIILLGLSRTCKTPISMYLACNHGLKVANIPIVADPILKENVITRLADLKKKKIVGLMMLPEILAKVREERSLHLAGSHKSKIEIQDYYDVRVIRTEVGFCRKLFAEQGWETVDVSRRAIEEISLEILERFNITAI